MVPFIGLTGGIGAGKSTALSALERLGAATLSTDAVVHDLYDSDEAMPPAVLCDGWFTGVWSRRFIIEHHAPVRVVGVHFKPWGLAPFIGLPLTGLLNRSVPAGRK